MEPPRVPAARTAQMVFLRIVLTKILHAPVTDPKLCSVLGQIRSQHRNAKARPPLYSRLPHRDRLSHNRSSAPDRDGRAS